MWIDGVKPKFSLRLSIVSFFKKDLYFCNLIFVFFLINFYWSLVDIQCCCSLIFQWEECPVNLIQLKISKRYLTASLSHPKSFSWCPFKATNLRRSNQLFFFFFQLFVLVTNLNCDCLGTGSSSVHPICWFDDFGLDLLIFRRQILESFGIKDFLFVFCLFWVLGGHQRFLVSPLAMVLSISTIYLHG